MIDKIKNPEITHVILKINENSYINNKIKEPNLKINQMLKDKRKNMHWLKKK